MQFGPATLVRPSFAFGMSATAIDVGSLFQRFTLGAAILFRCHAGTYRVRTLLPFLGVHRFSLQY
jgi:hypothetical protein